MVQIGQPSDIVYITYVMCDTYWIWRFLLKTRFDLLQYWVPGEGSLHTPLQLNELQNSYRQWNISVSL